MGVMHWNAVLDGELSEAALRRKLETGGYMVARYTYPPGTHFPEHTHEVDKIDAVISGRFRLVVGGHLFVLGPGDSIAVPRGVRHSATVVGAEPVVSLDAMKRP
jgi:quercetin dioxygenase-like cupin family protein